jgi:hypothetical protein
MPNGQATAAYRKVWKTIRLGTGIKSAAGFRSALKDAGMGISGWSNDLMDQRDFTVSRKAVEAELICMSVSELGFTSGVSHYDRLCRAAVRRDLRLCPAEVGPQLRLYLTDQPVADPVFIGMKPIAAGIDGSLSIFWLSRCCQRSQLLLCTRYGLPNRYWCGKDLFVFVRPMK